MRRFLAAASCVVVGFVLGVAFLGSTLSVRAVAVPTATRNGDTNGDGNVDISDAVYLLNFLFTGGAEIAGIRCPESPPRSCLVSTGQKECAGTASIVDCAAPKARGQDAFYQLGCPPEGRFVDNGDGTIYDNCTGLMWTRDPVDVDGDGEILSTDEKPWLEACQIAEDMTYLGHDDWRVPNIQELLSLVALGEADGSNAPLFAGAPLDARFGLNVDLNNGSWSSTHLSGGGARALGFGLRGTGTCDCCVVRAVDAQEHHKFVAVRGP